MDSTFEGWGKICHSKKQMEKETEIKRRRWDCVSLIRRESLKMKNRAPFSPPPQKKACHVVLGAPFKEERSTLKVKGVYKNSLNQWGHAVICIKLKLLSKVPFVFCFKKRFLKSCLVLKRNPFTKSVTYTQNVMAGE